MRAWFTTRKALIAQVAALTETVEWAARRKRRDDARHELELEMARAELRAERDAHRREAESLDAGNQTLIEQARWAEVANSRQAHRIAAAYRFADQLPPDLATELRGRLALTFPSAPEEATSAR